MLDTGARQARTGRRRGLVVAIAAAGITAAVAACGSSAAPSSAAGTGGPLLRLAQCMRAHGVSNFPDPGANGPGLAIPNSIDAQSPAFKAAQQSCAKFGGGPAPGSPESRQQELRLLTLARCMRGHGMPDLPDPTRSPPPPGNGNVVGGGGLYLALGSSQSQQSPAFKRAANACGFRLP
jgi:hypothetical protein